MQFAIFIVLVPCVSGWKKVNEERQSSGNPDQYDNK